MKESCSSSSIAFLKDLLKEGKDKAKEPIDEFDDGEDGSTDPKTQVSANRPQKCRKTLENQICLLKHPPFHLSVRQCLSDSLCQTVSVRQCQIINIFQSPLHVGPSV